MDQSHPVLASMYLTRSDGSRYDPYGPQPLQLPDLYRFHALSNTTVYVLCPGCWRDRHVERLRPIRLGKLAPDGRRMYTGRACRVCGQGFSSSFGPRQRQYVIACQESPTGYVSVPWELRRHAVAWMAERAATGTNPLMYFCDEFGREIQLSDGE